MASTQLISTDQAPAKEKVDYWRDVISSVYIELDTYTCESRREQDFGGTILLHPLPVIDLCEVKALESRYVRTNSHIARGNEEFFITSLLLSGRGKLVQANRSTELVVGDFTVFDSTRPYELTFDSTDIITLKIPRGAMLQRLPRAEDMTAVRVPGSQGVGFVIVQMLRALTKQYDSLDPSAFDALSSSVLDLVCAGLKSAAKCREQAQSSLHAYHLARIKAYVRENIGLPHLSVDQIAKVLETSTSSIYRYFEGEDQTLSQWIWSERLAGCRRDLADPNQRSVPVTKIGYRWGFSDPAHFCRMFKQAYNLTPSDFRDYTLQFAEPAGHCKVSPAGKTSTS